jgi:hypothetical protein
MISGMFVHVVPVATDIGCSNFKLQSNFKVSFSDSLHRGTGSYSSATALARQCRDDRPLQFSFAL